MGSRYLTELANWCREAGLVTHEESGWQTRARSSGGFDGNRPWCIMWHHTASSSSPQNDVNYMCYGSPDRPIANLLLDRNGEVWVMAAGATNTNGKGNPIAFTKGTVPKDSMNTHALSIEAANNGTGEAWPQRQIDSYFALNNKLTQKLDMSPTDLAEHVEYAPDRKIDPAVASAVQGGWRPRSINGSGSWNGDDVRAEALVRVGITPPDPGPGPGPDPTPPVPAPPMEEDDMRITGALDRNGTIWVGNGINRIALDNMEQFNNYVVLGQAGSYQFVNTSGQIIRELGHVYTVGDPTIQALGVPIG